MTRVARWIALVLTIALWSHSAAWGQRLPDPGQDPLAGARVFGAKGCSKCHSINGLGGKVGPDLARVARARTFFDLSADMWNHLDKMVAKMQELGVPRPRLDAREVGDLVGFLYTLNYFDRPGDRIAGRRLFTEKHCVLCHQVGEVGGVVGPNLDSFGLFASPIFIASAMWNHAPKMAEAMKEKGIERPAFVGEQLRDLIAFLTPATGGPRDGPIYMLPGRPEVGRQLFVEKRCIRCHSLGGSGGKVGPDLVEMRVRRSPIEFAAAIWNKQPAMLAAMKRLGVSVPELASDEMADIVAYLDSVRYFGNAGSPSRGQALLGEKGCLQCHTVSGEHRRPASDLAQQKGLNSPAALAAALWNHVVVTAPGARGGSGAWPQFRPQDMADLAALFQVYAQQQSKP